MWLSNGFSSYAAYMHEYSIIKHEQHASALPLQPYPPTLYTVGPATKKQFSSLESSLVRVKFLQLG